MGLSTVNVNVGQTGLGRRPLNKDKISGVLFFNDNLPSGFSSSNRVQKVYSLEEAEALGIVEGSANHDVNWYHISEYFRGNPQGELWIGYYAVPTPSYTWAEIATMLVAAGGEIRQLAVCALELTFASSQVTAIQAVWAALGAAYQQVSILFAANLSATTAVTGWAALADLRALTARKVSVVISEDGSGAGAALAATKAYSITNIGLCLGNLSKASVEQSIGNPQNFDISDGTEMEIPALANGDPCGGSTRTISDAILAGLKDKGYVICRKYEPDITGTYFERVPTSVVSTNDFAWIEVNRVVDKAIRGVRTALIPQLNASVLLKSDGTLRDDTVGYFQDIAQTPITQMEADSEISAGQVLIDPDQDVLTTSTLVISIEIVPVGIAETITVNIGLTLNLS